MHGLQQPLFQPNLTWKAPNLDDLPSWGQVKVLGWDTETSDPYLEDLGPFYVGREGEVIGYSFSIDRQGYYLPTGHVEGNLDPEKVERYLGDNLKVFDGTAVGSNLIYDKGVMQTKGLHFREDVKYHDIGHAEPIIDDLQFTYGLDVVALRYGLGGKDEALLMELGEAWKKSILDHHGITKKMATKKFIKKFMKWFPAGAVGHYAEVDATEPVLIREQQLVKLEAEGLMRAFKLECECMPAVLAMQLRGVRIDQDHLDVMEQRLLDWENEQLAKIKHISGIDFSSENLTKEAVIAEALKSQDIQVPMTPPKLNKRGKMMPARPSVKNKWLHDHGSDLCEAFAQAREFRKPRTADIASLRRHMVGDRLYPGYKQIVGESAGATKDSDSEGAKLGRFSSNHPNIQQQPVRHEVYGLDWRRLFIADEGARWACCDYSSQEPRWIVHFAELVEKMHGPKSWMCRGASEYADRYRTDPAMKFHKMTAAMAGVEYEIAKILGLSIGYGAGPAKVCMQLGLPTTREWSDQWGRYIDRAGPEGAAIIKKFHDSVPFLKGLLRFAKELAEQRGYVMTLHGRKCHFERSRDGSEYLKTYVALNKVIQPTAGEQMKQAIIDAHRAGIPMQMTVHDELNFSFFEEREVHQLADIMVGAVKCNVPHLVDKEIADNWGDKKKMKEAA